jgi:PAS domain S-box-containing protein
MLDHVHTASSITGGFFARLLEVYTPRRQCMNFEPDVIWLHFGSDLMIALAYFSIPIALVYFARRRKDLAYHGMFFLFALFIVLCGTTHLFNVWALWQPLYRLDGMVKFLTGVVSASTAILLWRLMPQALALPTAEELVRRKDELERLVTEKTAELTLANQALRESERRERERAEELETIMRSVPAAIWIARDPECRHITGNPASFRLLRTPEGQNVSASASEGESSGRAFREFRNGEPVPPDLLPMQRAAREGVDVENTELTLVFADGTERHILGNAVPLRRTDQSLRGAVSAFIDITELKRSEAARREGEEQFRQLAESIPQLCWMAYPDGQVFWYNKRWYEYTGTTFEQMQGWGWRSVHDASLLPEIIARWKQALAAGEPWEDTFPLRGKDGRFRRFLSRALPLRDASATIVRWFGTNTDIEDQKQAEGEIGRLLRQAEAAKADAEAANRMKDEFLAVVSHELRTPLNAIVGWAKILRSGAVDRDDLTEGLESIHRNANMQAQLVEDLLDVSRIISGTLRLDVQRVNLAEVIEAAIAAVTPAAQAKGIRTEKVLDPLAGPVSGDPARLQQVVWNLLSNAVKFTPKGGKVQVLLERVNSHVEISVNDTGQGIRPEFLPHVFERFRQADSTTTRRFGGLGLGLAIVKQLVEMHGGDVRAQSPGEGQGSTFVVHLPIAIIHEIPGQTQPGDPDECGPDGSRAKLDGLRVLVVDDEPDARSLLRHVLAECGAEVTLAGSAREAIEQLKAFRPDILVSDIGMPGEDGYDLLRHVRALHSATELPAAALTAFARAEDRKRALLAGFQTHVAKPVDPAELVAVVASLAGRTGRP